MPISLIEELPKIVKKTEKLSIPMVLIHKTSTLKYILIWLVALLFSACTCLTCVGNGTCVGVGAKCVGHGFCKSGYGKCIRSLTPIQSVNDAIKDIDYTCDGFGSCDGNMTCDGNISIDTNDIKYCQGKMICKEGSGVCQGDGVCAGGIGTCENALYANCIGYGTCAGVGTCLGVPSITIDNDISNESALTNHKKTSIQ